MSKLKTFRVDFFNTYHMCMRLKARSATDAIKKAERIFIDNPVDSRISMWMHDPFANAKVKPIVTFADIACQHGQGGEP